MDQTTHSPREALTDFLRSLEIPELSFTVAVIFRRPTKEEFRTHERLVIGMRLRWREVREEHVTGYKLFVSDGCMFVSPQLKDALQSAGFGYLSFYEGMPIRFGE